MRARLLPWTIPVVLLLAGLAWDSGGMWLYGLVVLLGLGVMFLLGRGVDRGDGSSLVEEHDWEARVGHLEQEGLDLLDVVTTAATLTGQLAGSVGRIVDIGSGPGVGTCELARCFPDAQVIALDASPSMLERAAERSRSLGVDDRVRTQLAELPNGLDDLGPADVVFASMSLHHIADPDQVLAAIHRLLTDDGLLVVIEHGPDAAHGHAPSIDAPAMLAAAGFDVIGDRITSGRTIIIGRPRGREPRVP